MVVRIGQGLRGNRTVVKLWGERRPVTITTISICPADIAQLHQLGYSHMDSGRGWRRLPEVLT